VTSGLVANIQRYSLQDGPGIRTTVFLKGCPLDCWWCHNPECRAPERELLIVESRCAWCGECVIACPEGIAAPAGPEKQTDACPRCGACEAACPTGARQIVGAEMTVDQVVKEIARDRVFFEESSGGVTFSGGEPLAQAAFVEVLLAACRSAGFHSALDTCGFAPEEKLLRVAGMADLVLFDVKILDDAKHKQFTGVSNVVILKNLRELCRIHPNVWLRIPVIPQLNDSPEDLEALASFAASLGGIRQVNLLPYHRTGMKKFERLGRTYALPDIVPPSAEVMENAVQCFAGHGIQARVGG